MTIRSKSALAFYLLAFFCVPLASCDAGLAQTPGAPRASIKLLTIGNSFADNSVFFLPGFAKASGRQILVFKANLGGRSLQQHAGYLQAFEADPNDPKGRAYKAQDDPRTGGKKDFSLREALESADWDAVTIQQASPLSFKPETYQPFAGILIAAIHKYAPHAEILILETWAYPDDFFAKFKEDGLNQQTMYAKVKAAYGQLSADTGLRILPVGDAFQKARALVPPMSLNIAGDKHANPYGKFLAAAVLYEVLFADNVESNPFGPAGISVGDAKILRRIAHETVTETNQNPTKKPGP